MERQADTRPVKVEVRDLTKKFGGLLVLDNLNFTIKKNEFVCVVGPTGCGKTTFLNVLTRIHEPTAGDLYIDGEPADPRKHSISFVFQEPSAFPWLTVEENIAFGLKVKKLGSDEIKKRVEQIISLMGLERYRRSYPRELSVSVLWKELGSTVVFITHNIEEAVYLAERVIILTNKPAGIKEEVFIDLPHPRDITDPRFIEYRNYITDKIKWW